MRPDFHARRFVRAVPLLSLCLGFAGCTDRQPIATLGDTGSSGSSGALTDADAEATQGAPTSGAGSTSGGATTDAPATTGSIAASEGTDAGGTDTGAASSGDTGTGDTGDTSSPAWPVTCGPPCPDGGWFHDGPLTLDSPASTDEFACMISVINGDLTITGDVDAAALAGLRNLRSVPNGVQIEFNAALTDLSPLACLEEVGGLSLFNAPNLTDTAALAGLKALGGVQFHGTGILAAPTFATDMEIGSVRFQNNPALVDLGPLAAWKASDGAWIEVAGNANLLDLVGVGALAASNPSFVQVRVIDNPKLASLAGLEPMTTGNLWLQDLPQVQDLGPLANLTESAEIALFGLPQVETLHGLHNLTAADTLIVGDCVSQELGTPGMDALVDLAGLDALTSVGTLALANNANLVALSGAPKLAAVNYIVAVGNPMLAPATVDAFAASFAAEPGTCVEGWDVCACFEFLPW